MTAVVAAEALISSVPKRILVVDDYLCSREMISEALAQEGCYEIREAEDGFKALELFRQEHFDLVISDIMMPGMSGMELLRQISEIDPATAVILITAHPETELTVAAMKKGAVDFLAKPFRIDDLLFKVNVCLREKDLSGQNVHAAKGAERTLQSKTRELSLQSYIYDSIECTFGDNRDIFEKITEMAMNVVEGDCCAVFLYDDQTQEFDLKLARFRDGGDRMNLSSLPLEFLKRAVSRREGILVRSEEFPEKRPAMMCVPLLIREHPFGALLLVRRPGGESFGEKELSYLTSLAKRASLNLENSVLYESLFNNILETFRSLINSIQARDFYTEEHSLRVGRSAVRLARALNCSEQDVESLKVACTLHDIGKIATPDAILLKAGRLTPAEYAIIREHPSAGERILRPMLLFEREREIILHHHERWDGSGYPDGLAGGRIPYLSMIISVCDSFDAMTSDRPYRRAMSVNAAAEEMKRHRGSQFDPEILDCFLKTCLGLDPLLS